MSFAIGLERFEALSLAGLALGAAGVLLIVLPDQGLPEAGVGAWVCVCWWRRSPPPVPTSSPPLPPAQDALARARLRHPARRRGRHAAGDAGGGRPLSLHRGGMAGDLRHGVGCTIHGVTFYCFQEVTRQSGTHGDCRLKRRGVALPRSRGRREAAVASSAGGREAMHSGPHRRHAGGTQGTRGLPGGGARERPELA